MVLWFGQWTWQNPIAITLTCREKPHWKSGIFSSATLDSVQKNLTHVLNRVNNNKDIFGNQGKRKKKTKRLQSVAVVEQNLDGRYHYHLQVDVPPGKTPDLLASIIELEWKKSYWGDRINHIQPVRDNGWLMYMLKLPTKRDYDLQIDVRNCHQTKKS
ncbi:MAG: hypothetical protein C0464_03495 [Cyanobacteria bacterium DS2.008]|nr:hypothetical protein [Cyanobacteria bacterium DS2.008]